MSVPQPFKAEVKTIALASGANAANDVSLTEIAGLPRDDREALGAALTRACDRYDILLQPHLSERRTSLLEGSATLAPAPGGREITIAFSLRRPDGTLDRRFEVRRADPKTTGALDPETTVALARDIAAALAAARGLSPAQAGNAARERPRVFLERVAGAPGDGNKALAAAMSAVLQSDGVEITANRSRATHVLAGAVALSETAEPATQTVSIAWRVLDPAGVKLAEISQSNSIPKGALDRAWGDTAYDVAQAASEGLVAAFEQMATAPAK
jgi:hypothetical protein